MEHSDYHFCFYCGAESCPMQSNWPLHCKVSPLSSLPHPGICPFSSYCVFITPAHPVISWQSLCGRPDVCFGKNAHFLPLCVAQCPQLLLCTHSLANPLLVDGDPKITQAGMGNLTVPSAYENLAGEYCTIGMYIKDEGKMDAPVTTQICFSPFQLSA